MDHYYILLSTELLDENAYSQVLKTLCRNCGQLEKRRSLLCSGGPGNHLVTVLSPDQDVQENQHPKEGDIWAEITSDQQTEKNIVHYHVPITDSQSECPNNLMLQRLHEIADSLPKIGAFVDVFWLFKDETLPLVRENIELYGACKKLLEWNNADFKFVALTSDIKDDTRAEPWVTLLRGHCVTSDAINDALRDVVWRGKIEVVGTNIRKPVQLPGFELRSPVPRQTPVTDKLEQTLCETVQIQKDNPDICNHLENEHSQTSLPRLLSNKLEVIAQLDRRDIPLLYYTGNCCTLCIPSKSKLVDKSRQFMQRLEDNPKLCYLVKLCHGTSWKSVKDDNCFKNNETKEEKKWPDFVQENIENVLCCPVMPVLDGQLGQHVLLLYAKHMTEDETTHSILTYEAHLLRLPEEFNGQFTHQMVVSALWLSEVSNNDIEKNRYSAEEVLSKLPHLTERHLVHLMKNIKKMQILALESWIERQKSLGQTIYISEADLIALLQAAHSKVIKSFKQNTDKLWTSSGPVCDNEENTDKEECKASFKDLERLVLECYSQTETKLNNCKANDSLAGLCPPSRGKVVTLNAAEFLKFFNKDGTAAAEHSTPVTLQKSSICKKSLKLNFEDLKNITWPECESLQYHDIYYSQGVTEAIEQKSRQLLSKILNTETCSTCIHKQAHNPAILAVETEPSNKSQRDREANVTVDRVTRSAVKRKMADEPITRESKRLYAAKKMSVESQSVAKTASGSTTSLSTSASENLTSSDAKAKRESRSQRHKRKLEEIVRHTLKKHGMGKDDPLFKACALRLYNITKSFVKDLTSSVGLRQEMERIAESNVQMIVDFERKNRQSTKK